MMMEDWRTLLYPLGFLSGLFFGSRFIIQWLQSERQGRSVVNKLFWQLSLMGNILLALHSVIQVQYHVCVVQVCNAIISWRNLNLMQRTQPPVTFRAILWTMGVAILLTTALFIFQYSLDGELHQILFRVPTTQWSSHHNDVSLYWHLIGFMGYVLFASRFWFQWWDAERQHKSTLPLSFWWISLSGALISVTYFIRIHDTVNLIGPALGIVPYIRNLMLIHKSKKLASTAHE